MTTAIIFLLAIIFIFNSFHFWWNDFDITISSRWLAPVVLVLYLIEKFY